MIQPVQFSGSSSNKCSALTGDCVEEIGLDPFLRNGQHGYRGGTRYLTAGEWANAGIRTLNGWSILPAGDSPRPGDIFAYKLTGGGGRYTGHTGVVVAAGKDGITYVAAHSDGVYSDLNQLSHAEAGYLPVFRRYTGR